MKLKNCPFCGKESAVVWNDGRVVCDNTMCHVQVIAESTFSWNERHTIFQRIKSFFWG